MTDNLLFVYGILRDGYIIKNCNKLNKYLGKATTTGYIYDLGAFPGAIFDSCDKKIIGDVFVVDNSTLEMLDHLEGTQSGFYDRIKIKVQLKNSTIECFAYEFSDKKYLCNNAKLIPSGNFYNI